MQVPLYGCGSQFLPSKASVAVSTSASSPIQDETALGGDSLQKAFERAQKRFGHLLGVQIQVFSHPSSGNQPVVVLSNSLANGPRILQTHFHGDQLYDKDVHYEDEIGKCVGRAWERTPNVVLVLPEAKNEDQAPRSDWNNIANVVNIADKALEQAGLNSADVAKRILSGHSAGGSVVAKAMARNDLGLGRYDQIELYDAAVSSQHNPVGDTERAKIKEWCRERPSQFLVVPGIMKSSWLDYIPSQRWTEKASDHWSPLWQSLGMERSPTA